MKLAALLPSLLVGVIFLPLGLADNGELPSTGPIDWTSLLLDAKSTYEFGFRSVKEGNFELWISRYSKHSGSYVLYHYSVYSYHPANTWQKLTINAKGLQIFNGGALFPYYIQPENGMGQMEVKIKSTEMMWWKDCSARECEFQEEQTQKPQKEEDQAQKPPQEHKTSGLSRFGLEMIVAAVGFCLLAVNVFIDVREYRAGRARPQGDNGTVAAPATGAATAAPAAPRVPPPLRWNVLARRQ